MTQDPTVRAAVIVDLVGSRRHTDRAWVHARMMEALQQVNQEVDFDQPLEPTLGDESQARYLSVESALRATLALRLALPEELDCRAGIGVGEVEDLGRTPYGPLQDGPAWWAARDAIVEAKSRESVRDRTLRTWYQVSERLVGPSRDEYPPAELVNAFLLTRDEIVTQMSGRSRRLLRHLLAGASQVEMAVAEGISTSAVSQNLRRSGAFAVQSSQDQLASWFGGR
ncbi:SatD family protein [Aeromicrobium wangtongii]|uniref:SatD family protein n=1 Tax=Aeromicrobium wangtongii TaxID=2969247 RepID=A0ABY5M6K0_9ACTN|nr:SatD family protein [Aeromicrobium wangtongii]MCD9198558.1 SatD family protein [Aeromicrobium wangtongii]UUP12584.1 SatD family protein [Aeromicrobium wangtongii]